MRWIVCFVFVTLAIEVSAKSHSFPRKLSEWGLSRVVDRKLVFKNDVTLYQIVNPLFTDYALKVRTVWIPDGKSAAYKAEGPFDFPEGTILTKTFAYRPESIETEGKTYAALTIPGSAFNKALHLVETRVLVRKAQGWIGLPYIWNEEQTEATLSLLGKKKQIRLKHSNEFLSFEYRVPNFNQCKSCHVKQEGFRKWMQPIGPSAENLNRIVQTGETQINQLKLWAAKGLLEDLPESDIPSVPSWKSDNVPLPERARAYLAVNCAHCHNPDGPASSSGLSLGFRVSNPTQLGVCKTPVAAGNGGLGGRYDIHPGEPDDSIVLKRMDSLDPSVMMPELGRSLIHKEGVNLIRNWIATMEGTCG